MAKQQQTITDEEIALALIESKTRREAAEKLNMPTRTLYERMQSFAFQSILSDMRAEQLKNRLQILNDAQNNAAATLYNIMVNEECSAGDRIRAAVAILDAGRAARQELQTLETDAVGRMRAARRLDREREGQNRAEDARARGEMVLDFAL